MSLIFQNGSRTRSYGPGEKMPALPPQPKGGFGKPSGSQDYFAGGSPYFDERTGQRTGPGQAQPIQTPPTGTKYGAYTPPSSQTTGDPRGAYANAPPSQRPPPMQIAPAQTPFGPSMDPFAERDAFVRQIGQQRINNQIAFNTSGPNAPQGSPFINYGMAAQNAGLGGGAPSKNASPADTFIGRFNNQYGAPVNPGFGGGQSQNAYYPGGPGGFPVEQQSPGSARPIAPQQPESYYPGFDPRTQDPYGQPVPRPASNLFRPMPRGFEEVKRPPVYMGGQRLVSDPTNGLRPPRVRSSYGRR